MARWATGADTVNSLLNDRSLEQVQPSTENAQRLITDAERHLESARVLAQVDPAGAYDMLYSAARKSMAAVLAVQGLRATSRGGHIAVQEAVAAQLGRTDSVVRPFSRMRRTRNDADYPRLDTPTLDPGDVEDDLGKSQNIVDAMKRLLPHLEAW